MADDLIFISRQNIPPAYLIDDLGHMPGGRLSHASAINRRGDVVGEADSVDGMRAFVWRGKDLIDLGTLGGHRSSAVDINDDGQIVGMTEAADNQRPRPYLWQDGRMIDLEGHGAGKVHAVTGINNECQIVGSALVVHQDSADIEIPGEMAFRWQLGNVTNLTDITVRSSEAKAISEYGAVVGDLYEPLIDRHMAFVWTDGRLVVLGAGSALDINIEGTVAGYSSISPNAATATLWYENVRRDIPMPRGVTYSRAHAINSNGDVVGVMGTSPNEIRPFLWSRDHLTDLNDTIDPRTGWSLRDAADINDDGQIVGWGFLNHRHHAYRMTFNPGG